MRSSLKILRSDLPTRQSSRLVPLRSIMGFFYFDESIHEKGGFIIGAFVYHEGDITPSVFGALAEAGLRPGIDEFKSGSRMVARVEQGKARDRLRGLLNSVRIGVVVIPATEREKLGDEAIAGLGKILEANKLFTLSHQVFLDHGIVVKGATLEIFRNGPGGLCEVHMNQDSRVIGGIQLADLAAHSMSVMLLEQMGLVKKMIKAGENSGYDPELGIELGFELWVSLRYSFFKAPEPKPGPFPNDPVGELIYDVERYGLHIAATCNERLREAALFRFGECYFGCIH
jgi:hypothetical protein